MTITQQEHHADRQVFTGVLGPDGCGSDVRSLDQQTSAFDGGFTFCRVRNSKRVHAIHDPCVLCPGLIGWPSSDSGRRPDQFLESSRCQDQAAEQGILVVPGTPRRNRRAPAAAINPLCLFAGAVLELCALVGRAPTLACHPSFP